MIWPPCCSVRCLELFDTPLKFNSSPPKIRQSQKDFSSSNHHFSGAKMLNFGGVRVDGKKSFRLFCFAADVRLCSFHYDWWERQFAPWNGTKMQTANFIQPLASKKAHWPCRNQSTMLKFVHSSMHCTSHTSMFTCIRWDAYWRSNFHEVE